jgi:hypothetical protein
VLLVIFGAGASYDSVPDFVPGARLKARVAAAAGGNPEDLRPPLANELFDNRPLFVNAMTRFPEFLPLVPILRKKGVAVEKELARFQAQADKFPRVHQELAAIRYYLHFALWECQRFWRDAHKGITNHLTLLREIERWRYECSEQVCFVTFNYDTMLEEAIQQFLDFEIRKVDDYLSLGSYMLIKLHGSINWGYEIDISPTGYTVQRIIKERASLQITNHIELIRGHPMLEQEGRLYFPAVSIPVENKDEFTCPEKHVEALEAALPKVTKVLTVGWRATEQDFLNKLQYKLPEKPDLMIISGDANGAGETYSNLTRQGPTRYRQTQHGENGFTGLIMNSLGLLDAFLREPPSEVRR